MNRDQTYVNQMMNAIKKIQEYTVEGRDVLIHDYDSIDMSIVWNVITIELPQISVLLGKVD